MVYFFKILCVYMCMYICGCVYVGNKVSAGWGGIWGLRFEKIGVYLYNKGKEY